MGVVGFRSADTRSRLRVERVRSCMASHVPARVFGQNAVSAEEIAVLLDAPMPQQASVSLITHAANASQLMHGCEAANRLAIFDDRARGLGADPGDGADLCFAGGVQVDRRRTGWNFGPGVLAVRGGYFCGEHINGRG